MNDERWTIVDRLFGAALECAPHERAAFLGEACAGDETLRREVESLLAHASRAEGFMSTPALGGGAPGRGVPFVGRRVGPYVIQAPLGAGGMGEVYRARDGTLGRDVAIKILPRIFNVDPDRRARFDREARLLAALNHPHIGAIYGVEEIDGIRALVLELVEGDTLAERLAQGPLPVSEALHIARQIADALDAAHEKGIVHRDLKPANIKITPEGVVKVLDFGLARATSGDASGPDLTQSPTRTIGGTRDGVILGTAAYMSPEQARGKAVDKRADIWAFGCVLYEMLTGQVAFAGDTVSDTIAAILEREPDWSKLPPSLPAPIRELLRRSLEKDLKRRRRDIGDVRFEIDQTVSGPGHAATPLVKESSSAPARLSSIVAAVLGVALTVAVARPYFSTPAEAPERRFDITTPEMTGSTGFAISPEGRRLVFAAIRNGRPQLYLRSLDGNVAEPLNGTEGASLPFWSPDGRTVGFFANNQLKRIDLDGGLVQTLAKIGLGQGGTWGSDGVILFAMEDGPLLRVPASGGEPVAVTKVIAGAPSLRFPVFLPGGRQFVFYATGAEAVRGIYLGSLDSPDSMRLTEADANGDYLGTPSGPGWLLFVRQGALVARRFDPPRRQLSGDPVTVAESVAVDLVRGAVSVSATGVIAYRTGATTPRQLTWFDRSGRTLGTLGEPDRAGQMNVELSQDALRAAVQRTIRSNMDVWIIDSTRTTPFTFDGGGDGWPLWSPDDSRIVYVSNKTGSSAFYRRASNSTDADTDEWLGVGILCDWSSDGRSLLYIERSQKTGMDLWAVRIDGDRKPVPIVHTNFNDLWGQFSPNGQWVAYQSNESGRHEIYVRPFSGPGAPVPVSTSGGINARWAPDGKDLFFIALDGKLMAASFTAHGATPDVGAPIALFQTAIVGGGTFSPGFRQQYDVAPDGRFLINVALESAPAPITLILDWKDR